MRRHAIVSWLVTGILAATGAASAQSGASAPQGQVPAAPPPVFSAGTTLIQVDAVVTDRAGNVVRDLSPDDFIVLDGGRRQTVSAFTFVDVPAGAVRGTQPVGVEPDVATNAEPFDGRVYLLVFDDRIEIAPQAMQVAHLFIDRQLRDNDLMAVLSTGRGFRGQEFTGNRRLLHAAVDELRSNRINDVETRSIDGSEDRGGSADGRTPATEGVSANAATEAAQRAQAESTLAAVAEIADWAGATIPGRRKSMVFISGGVGGLIGCENPLTQSRLQDLLCEAVGAAARANVSIYPVDPRGLEFASTGIEFPAGQVTTTQQPFTDAQLETGQRMLRTLADETGGVAVVRTNNFTEAMDAIVRDSSSYYMLGYVAPQAASGRFRAIEVRVRRPGLQVRARRGYQLAEPAAAAAAPAGVAAPELQRAIDSGLPIVGLPMRTFTVPLKGATAGASVLIGVEFPDVALTPANAEGRRSAAIEFAIAAVTLRTVAGTRAGTIRAAVQGAATGIPGGLRLLSRLDLPPGRYQLRVSARDTTTNRIGAVRQDLEVPDFASARVELSGIIVATERVVGQTVWDPPDSRLVQVTETPSGTRSFMDGDVMVATAELYVPDSGPLTPFDVVTRIINVGGAAVARVVEQIVPEAGGSRHTHVARMPLDGLPPGEYVLEMSAGLDAAGTATRRVAFTIEPASVSLP